MKKINLIYALIFLFFIFLFFSCSKAPKQELKAKSGTIDLTTWNFEKNGIHSLNGEWEFYWNQLHTPDDFKGTNTPNLTGYFTIPKVWNKYTIDDKKLGSNGYATFRVRVQLPKSKAVYTLKFNRVETAYKLWINDDFINEVGKIGVSGKEQKAKWIPQNYTFYADKDYVDIILQVSNYKHRKGGIAQSIKIGTPEAITNNTWLFTGYELFLLGALLIMAIYPRK